MKDLYGSLSVCYDKSMAKKQPTQYSWPGLITILILVIVLAGTLWYTWEQNTPRIKPLGSTTEANAQK